MIVYILVWTITTGFPGNKTVSIDVHAFKAISSCMRELDKLKKSEGEGNCMKFELE